MARLRVEVEAFRKGKDDAFFGRVLREWQRDAHGRALVRRSIVGMARKRDERVGSACSTGYSAIVDPINKDSLGPLKRPIR